MDKGKQIVRFKNSGCTLYLLEKTFNQMKHDLGRATVYLLIWKISHQIHLTCDMWAQAYLVMAFAIDRVNAITTGPRSDVVDSTEIIGRRQFDL